MYSTYHQYFGHFTGKTRLFVEKNGKIVIGENSRINGATIHGKNEIKIGKNVLIAANTTIADFNGHDLCMTDPKKRICTFDEPKKITICDNVWIGLNCVVLKNVTIGEGSVIGTGSVVTSNIPTMSIARGNPAAILKYNSKKK